MISRRDLRFVRDRVPLRFPKRSVLNLFVVVIRLDTPLQGDRSGTRKYHMAPTKNMLKPGKHNLNQ